MKGNMPVLSCTWENYYGKFRIQVCINLIISFMIALPILCSSRLWLPLIERHKVVAFGQLSEICVLKLMHILLENYKENPGLRLSLLHILFLDLEVDDLHLLGKIISEEKMRFLYWKKRRNLHYKIKLLNLELSHNPLVKTVMGTLMTTDGSGLTSEHHLENAICPREIVFRKESKNFGHQYT